MTDELEALRQHVATLTEERDKLKSVAADMLVWIAIRSPWDEKTNADMRVAVASWRVTMGLPPVPAPPAETKEPR
jgi:hypothetical protein